MRLNVYPIIFALLLSVPTGAVTYTPSIENTQWQLQPSIYGCIFRQPIPVYGFASFFQEAGEDLIFYLEPSYDRMKKGDADLVIEAPDWLPNITTTNLGKIAVEDNSLPIRIDSTRSDRMLSELGKGMAPTVTGSAIFEDEDIRVRVSPAKFNQYYVDFVACIAGLLPVNFSQVERVSIQFDVGQQELDKEHQARLSLIATYVLADPLVTTVYIDAHTDNQGTRYLNRRVAEKRMLNPGRRGRRR